MVKRMIPLESVSEETHSDFQVTQPPAHYPATDFRFVMIEISKLSSCVERLIADVKTLTNRVDILQLQVDSIHNKVDSLERQVDSLNNKVGALNDKVDSLERQVDSIEHQVGLLQHQVSFVKGGILDVIRCLRTTRHQRFINDEIWFFIKPTPSFKPSKNIVAKRSTIQPPDTYVYSKRQALRMALFLRRDFFQAALACFYHQT